MEPTTETLLNWNNKPAPEWGAASENYSYGPLHRVLMYKGFTTKGMTEAKDVGIMNKAATEDFRATLVWPVDPEGARTHAGTGRGHAGDERRQADAQVDQEAGPACRASNSRKQLAAAVIESVFTPMAEAVMGPVLGELLPELRSIEGTDNGPNSGGSSFGGGWYGYVYKDLRH